MPVTVVLFSDVVNHDEAHLKYDIHGGKDAEEHFTDFVITLTTIPVRHDYLNIDTRTIPVDIGASGHNLRDHLVPALMKRIVDYTELGNLRIIVYTGERAAGNGDGDRDRYRQERQEEPGENSRRRHRGTRAASIVFKGISKQGDSHSHRQGLSSSQDDNTSITTTEGPGTPSRQRLPNCKGSARGAGSYEDAAGQRGFERRGSVRDGNINVDDEQCGALAPANGTYQTRKPRYP